jgi:hypothetical protein
MKKKERHVIDQLFCVRNVFFSKVKVQFFLSCRFLDPSHHQYDGILGVMKRFFFKHCYAFLARNSDQKAKLLILMFLARSPLKRGSFKGGGLKMGVNFFLLPNL